MLSASTVLPNNQWLAGLVVSIGLSDVCYIHVSSLHFRVALSTKAHHMSLRMQEVEKLTAALEGNTTLQELTACHHPHSVDDARCFAAALHNNSTLRSLNFGDASFGDEAIAALAEGLSGVLR